MDYNNMGVDPSAGAGGDISSILQSAQADQNSSLTNNMPVPTESMDLEAIYNATYESEMAKYNAQLEAAQQQLNEAVQAAQAAQVQSIVDPNALGVSDLNAQTMASVLNQTTPQDLSNINSMISNYNNTTPTNFAEGTLTAGGFVMPTAAQKEVIYSIVAAEGGSNNPQEARNIMSTMINRAKTGRWAGNDLYKIATAPNQYVVYQTGKSANASLSPESRAAVDNLLATTSMGGATDHIYQSFRSNGSTSYSNTILTPGGNRYGNPMV